MTIVADFSSPWNWLPFIDWFIEKKDFVIAVGWGPFQLYIMSYSPIAESNSLKEVVNSLVDGNEDKFNRLLSLVDGTNHFTRETFNRMVQEIRDN